MPFYLAGFVLFVVQTFDPRIRLPCPSRAALASPYSCSYMYRCRKRLHLYLMCGLFMDLVLDPISFIYFGTTDRAGAVYLYAYGMCGYRLLTHAVHALGVITSPDRGVEPRGRSS